MKVIFIHDIGQDESAWFPVIRQINNIKADTYSYNDAIRSSKIPQYKTIKQDLSHYLSDLQEPYILCGQSLGGKLAIDLANDLGELLQGMILISTNHNEKKSAGNKLKLGVMSFMPKQTFIKSKGLSKDQVMSVMSSVRDIDLSRQLTEFRKPALIIASEEDKTNYKAGKEMTDLLLYNQLITLAKGGPNLNESHSQEVAEAIQNFVRKFSE